MPTTHELHPARFSDAPGNGLRVFPVLPQDKKPAVPWKEYQTIAASPDDLAKWDKSDFNVGVVTGVPSGIVVLDVDSAKAQALVDGLNLPPTPAVSTARGQHLYFKHPGFTIRNGVNIQGVKLDVRGDGGYVVGAGSIHETGALYEWITSPEEVPFAPLPESVLALLRANKSAATSARRQTSAPMPTTGTDGLDQFLADELADAKRDAGNATEGERNTALFKASARLARHVAGANVDWGPFAEALASSARTTGLDEGEILATIQSGWKAGSVEPTQWIQVAQDHAYLSYQERFYHLPSGKDLKPTGFNGQFGNLYRGKGTFSNFLLMNGYVRKLFDLTYEPCDESRIIERDGYEWLNTFRPSEVQAVEGDASQFIDFLTRLVPNETERNHLTRMIAFTVRHPGSKLRHALLLRTAMQGVGKSMLIDIWSGLLGPHNVRKTTSKELASDYQGYLPERLLIVCEELNLGAGAKTYNDLKDMITAEKTLVNEKHLRQREWDNYASFAFLSNLPSPILIEANDRRFFYIDSPAQKQEVSYYKKFAAWWQSNLGVIRHYLDQVDLSTFEPHHAPPVTDAKIALIARSRSELTQDLESAIASREGLFDRDLVTLEQVRLELGYLARIKTRRQLSDALREAGAISLKQQRVGLERASLWAIRNTGYWFLADLNARADEFKRRTGIFAFLDGTGMEVGHMYELPVDAWRGAEGQDADSAE